MQKILVVIGFWIMSLVYGQAVLAHGDGHAAINDEQAVTVATAAVAELVASDVGLGFGKLDPSWNRVSKNAKRVESKKGGYYIVSVQNKGEGRTLFILMSEGGAVYDANFTGKFEGVQ